MGFADRWDDILSDKLTPDDIPEEFSFSVCLGDHKKELDDASLLDYLWDGGLDTRCLVCDSQFTNEEPPIRTVSLDAVSSQAENFHISLGVINRHMKCLRREDIQYIPISHVWHSSVATAHDNHEPNAEAARDVRITVVKVLLATVYWEDENIEIWHDYFSIPQWQPDIQQRLLLELPHIYAYPPYIIVHQHDADPLCYADLLNEHQQSDEQLIRAVIKPATCRWFSRMWVVLEYAVSQKAYILMENWELHAKSLYYLLKKMNKIIENVDHHTKLKYMTDNDNRAFWSMVPWARLATSGGPNCMGSAFHALSQSSCREHRDRFLAAYGLLYWNTDSGSVLAKVPSDQIEACLWLSMKRLEAGDYTPLLLEPSGYETSVQPSWLRGHTNISPDSWSDGNQKSPPLQPMIVRDGKVEPDLEVVGQLQAALLHTKDAPVEMDFDEIVGLIVSISGPDPRSLVRMLASIFPAWYPLHDVLIFEDSILVKVQGCLDDYCKAQTLQGLDACARISTQIRSLLDFDRPGGFNGGRQEYLRDIEFVCKLKCPKCGIAFFSRLEIWSHPGENACVYRIPGLRYAGTAPDRLGLIIEDNKIIGRMMNGVRMCDCHELRRVLIV